MEWSLISYARHALVTFAILVSAVALSGCSSATPMTFKPPTQATSLKDAGTSHVAVTAVIPWEKVESDLGPDYDLKPADALTAAIPVTQSVVEKLINSLGFNIGIGLPQRGTTQTTTQQADNSGTTTTSTATTTHAPGTAPAPTLPAAPAKNASELTASGAVTLTDPLLRYHAATTLYQEVKLLKAYVNFATSQKGYKPYLVRLQVSLLPRQRHLALDAFTNVLFYPDVVGFQAFSVLSESRAPVYVVPIISMDNLEASSTQSAIEAIRSASLSLQGLIGNVGVGVGAGKTSDAASASAGNDLNALLTVARASSNAIRVRMGAMYEGSTQYAMIPRSHYVTVLLLVAPSVNRINVVTNTSFVDVNTGIELSPDANRDRESLAVQADAFVSNFGFTLDHNCAALAGEPELAKRSLELLRLVQLGEYDTASGCLGMTPAATTRATYVRLIRMFSKLLALEIESTTGKIEFDLPD